MNHTDDIIILIDRLTDIVREASAIMKDSFEVKNKGCLSNIVTTNDKAIQAFLKKRLKELLPESGFLCEEDDYCTKKEKTWIIDPIDGTANYSRGIDFCAISIALVKK